MPAVRLVPRAVEKPWGRSDLPSALGGGECAAPIGEIWFEDPRGGDPAPLLIKYLFTSEKLSVQVHPDDAMARAGGLPSGKDEAWLILDAEPSAEIGVGLRVAVSRDELRTASKRGTVEQLLEWRPARQGDFYYLGAGTIHALGAGVKLVEVQQNADVTYRLYDYGRPRELHVDEAVAAARLEPSAPPSRTEADGPGRMILAQDGKFVIELWSGPHSASLPAAPTERTWVLSLKGSAVVAGEAVAADEIWLVEGSGRVEIERGGTLMLAYPGASLRDGRSR